MVIPRQKPPSPVGTYAFLLRPPWQPNDDVTSWGQVPPTMFFFDIVPWFTRKPLRWLELAVIRIA